MYLERAHPAFLTTLVVLVLQFRLDFHPFPLIESVPSAVNIIVFYYYNFFSCAVYIIDLKRGSTEAGLYFGTHREKEK